MGRGSFRPRPGNIRIWRSDFPRKPGPSSSRKSSFPVTAELWARAGVPLSGGLHSPKGRALPAAQPLLPLPRSAPTRLRSVRRAFKPAPAPGPYRLPHDVRDRLAAALTPYRNRDAAYDLATFLGRFWSSPARLTRTFVIDRRALAQVSALDLTEARVRGAIRALEEFGYIARAVPRGSPYQPTPEGLRRKPVEFQFGTDYVPLLVGANRRAAAGRGGGLSGPAAP